MKSLQDYINTYRNIASKLNIRGDSAEILIQLLANASYINEVENIAYSLESSIEKATQMNSKIQHCMDVMHSVFRGLCPRVILNIKPLKYFSFNTYDEIVTGNSFKLYYLGYYKEDENNGEGALSYDTGIVYGPLTLPPSEDKTTKIVCLLATDIIEKEWTLSSENTYYLDCTENSLSNDISLLLEDKSLGLTTQFSDHLINHKIFDLTLPSFGTRLYITGCNKRGDNTFGDFETNTKFKLRGFKYTTLDSYNSYDLKKINIKGAELIDGEETSFWVRRNLNSLIPGVYLVKESERDSLVMTHYKANQGRYTNSIIRSNYDLGDILENDYPNKIVPSGTNVVYTTNSDNSSSIIVYYIPMDSTNNYITNEEIQKFNSERKSYYIAKDIKIEQGECYIAKFNVELELYENLGGIGNEVEGILKKYSKKFGINFLSQSDQETIADNESVISEIEILISKLSNVKKIRSLSIDYSRNGRTFSKYKLGSTNEISEDYYEMINNLKAGKVYYDVTVQIKSIL